MLIPVQKMKTTTIINLLSKSSLHPDNKKVLVEELNYRYNNNLTLNEMVKIFNN
jgi:hypothetical protein